MASFTARVAEIINRGNDIRIIGLAPESGDGMIFLPGQFAMLTFNGFGPHPYSIASHSDHHLLEFHIRAGGKGGASDYAVKKLKTGEEVGVEGPYGAACLPPGHSRPILAIGGGLGVAPLKSIIESALQSGPARPVHLYHGARSEEELYLNDHFRELSQAHEHFSFVPVTDSQGHVGDVAAAGFDNLSAFSAWLAGPPEMVEKTTALLIDKGMAPEEIFSDNFQTQDKSATKDGTS